MCNSMENINFAQNRTLGPRPGWGGEETTDSSSSSEKSSRAPSGDHLLGAIFKSITKTNTFFAFSWFVGIRKCIGFSCTFAGWRAEGGWDHLLRAISKCITKTNTFFAFPWSKNALVLVVHLQGGAQKVVPGRRAWRNLRITTEPVVFCDFRESESVRRFRH